jgi:hypothetical protein
MRSNIGERVRWSGSLSDPVYEEHLDGSLSAPRSVFEDEWPVKSLVRGLYHKINSLEPIGQEARRTLKPF